MELRQLEYFRVIAETESIHEAARRLNMSQPPLSYQLKQLEAELNVTLFERTRQGVRLTEAGKLLYDRSANLLEYVKSTELEVAKVGKKRVLRLGITPTTVATIMPCVSLFSRRNPDVNFEVHDGITYTLYRYLMDGIIDISIARTPLRLDDVDYKILSSEPMIAVSSKDMLPEKNGSLKLSDLLNIPLIIYRRYEALIMDAFHSRGMEPDLFCVCDDPRGAMLWAKEGLATAIFPQSMSSLCQGLRIQPLAESDLETQIAVIWKKGRKLSPLLQDFVDACMESFRPYLEANRRTTNTVFHASLNPSPEDKLTDGQLRDIAQEYMERMGYGNQPYIVFKHKDIDRQHLHVVSLRVDENGHKLPHDFEARRSMEILRDLERKYNLYCGLEKT